MRYAIKDESGNVINVIVALPEFVEGYCQENGFTFELLDDTNTDPPPASETAVNPTVWDELDAAYQEGVNSAYDS